MRDDRPKVGITGKDELNAFIWNKTNGIVQTGPFKGMQLVKDESWKDGNLGPKCLGCYETELHATIAHEVERLAALEAPTIVNIGCAEGYYAVGLAMLLPKAIVYAVDIDPEALRIAGDAAVANHASIVCGGDLAEVMAAPNLIVMDCEGNETDYLDSVKFPAIDAAHIIVECHDWNGQSNTEILLERFRNTHEVLYCISEAGRRPNDFEFLCCLSSHAKWLAVSEGRPSTQYFLYMRPRA